MFSSSADHQIRSTSSWIGFGLLIFSTFMFMMPVAHAATDISSNDLITQTNAQRAAAGLSTLRTNAQLTQAAQAKANDEAAKGYFAHTSPDGSTSWYWFTQAGYSYSHAGENLAEGFTTSTGVTTAWMNSPTHRANIMDGKFSEIGIATAEGMYQGRKVTFVVQMFGTPRVAAVAASATPLKKATVAPTVSKPVAVITQKAPKVFVTATAPTKVLGAETTVSDASPAPSAAPTNFSLLIAAAACGAFGLLLLAFARRLLS